MHPGKPVFLRPLPVPPVVPQLKGLYREGIPQDSMRRSFLGLGRTRHRGPEVSQDSGGLRRRGGRSEVRSPRGPSATLYSTGGAALALLLDMSAGHRSLGCLESQPTRAVPQRVRLQGFSCCGTRSLTLGLPRFSGSPALRVDYAASSTRRRNNSKLARPYIWRLRSLSFVTCPSACALLQGVVRAARTASPSCSSPAAKVPTTRTPHVCAWRSHASKDLQHRVGLAPCSTPRWRTISLKRRASATTRSAS